jgi:hypothetical protein
MEAQDGRSSRKSRSMGCSILNQTHWYDKWRVGDFLEKKIIVWMIRNYRMFLKKKRQHLYGAKCLVNKLFFLKGLFP